MTQASDPHPLLSDGSRLVGDVSAFLRDFLQVTESDLSSRPFEELVADSVEAVELSDRVFERLGVKLDLPTMYTSPTVSDALRSIFAPAT